MTIIDSIKASFVPIHREGWRFIALAAIVSLVLGALLTDVLFWIGMILTGWICYFFRDPPRVTPVGKGLVISPADGTVSSIGTSMPPPELGLSETPLLRVSVFMNVFNCHVNRAPIGGLITKTAYKPGKFLNAELDKASDDNERNGMVIEADGTKIGVVQIAGLVARRIVCWCDDNDVIQVGDRFGLIRFGSRLDVYLPLDTPVRVAVGQTAIAGETVLALIGGDEISTSTFRKG